ncbi:MAG: hypothetical protein U5K54_18175 [Cytophagales bacterium]|nr:hypothetical protein [Cytophagales bacterium]
MTKEGSGTTATITDVLNNVTTSNQIVVYTGDGHQRKWMCGQSIHDIRNGTTRTSWIQR